jgi:hypothetical protein
MSQKLQQIAAQERVRTRFGLALYPLSGMIMGCLCLYVCYTCYNLWVDLADTSARVEILRNTFEEITVKKALPSSQRDEYVRKLTTAIPVTEDVFKITRSVTRLITQSNLTMDQFTPPPTIKSKSSGESPIKMTVKGTLASMNRFLEQYMWAGGRYMVMRSATLSYSATDVEGTFDFMLYTLPIPNDITQLTGLDDPQRKLLEEIKGSLELIPDVNEK